MAERILKDETPAPQRSAVLQPSPDQGWRLLVLVGLIVGAAGWLDVLMLWYPPQFGKPEWEFGTVSAMFSGLPLATIGLALVMAGGLAAGWNKRLRVLGWFSAAVFVLLLAALVLYALNVPVAWKGVPPAALPVLKRAMAKTTLLAILYLGMYAVFGVTVWRRLRAVGTLRRQGA